MIDWNTGNMAELNLQSSFPSQGWADTKWIKANHMVGFSGPASSQAESLD